MGYVRAFVLSLILASVLVSGCTPAATPPPPTDVPPAPTEPPVVSTEEVEGHWEMALQMKVEQPVRMAAFLDETFGVTGGGGGDAGKAQYSTDDGQTWTMADTSGG